MSGKDHEKNAFTFMDGIPVKISEQYKPPRKVTLPVGFQNRLSQPPVKADYNFDLENGVLEKLKQWREVKSAEREKRRERVALDDARLQHLREAMEELSVKDEKSSEPTESSSSPASELVPQTNSVPPSVHSDSIPKVHEPDPILRPIPINHQFVPSQVKSSKPIHAFNISDFESDTSSPFDNMELKTLNDLEELAQVLQPTTTVAQQPQYYHSDVSPNTRDTHQGYNSILQTTRNTPGYMDPLSYSKSYENKVGMGVHSQVNGYSSGYNVYGNMHSGSSHSNNYQMNPSAVSYPSQSVIPPITSCEANKPYNFIDQRGIAQASSVPYRFPTPDARYDFYPNNLWRPSDGYRTPNLGHDTPSNSYITHKAEVANSSSAVTTPPEQTKPAYRPISSPGVNSIAQELSELMKSRMGSTLSNLSEHNEVAPQSSPSNILPDPFPSLTPECQRLVQRIAEMGFPRARVARSCQRFDGNEPKVVEYLLSLRTLLDSGYSEERAERALNINNQDTKAALHYLQVESQLLALGFQEDGVRNALVKFKCDIDQALDYLIS